MALIGIASMTTPDRLRISLPLLLLDMIGALSVAIGLAKTVAGIDLLPADWRFGNDGIILLLVGAMLMVPFNLHLLQQILARAARERARSGR